MSDASLGMETPPEPSKSCGCGGGGGASEAPCPSCGRNTAPSHYVYAIGRVEPRFPKISVERELAQATRGASTSGLTDRQALRRVLSERAHRYLARQLCWVFTVADQETFVIVPRDPFDWELLVNALRSDPGPADLDVLIGVRTGTASPDMCNGVTLPIVAFDQLYSFDRESMIKAIERPENIPAKEFHAASGELLQRVLRMADNSGVSSVHRALNYLAVRYPGIYVATAEAFGRNASLSGVKVTPSGLSAGRDVVNVIFSYTARNTDVTEKFFVRVDVTDEFPFLVSKLAPYYDLPS